MNEITDNLKKPAIALIIVGSLNGIFGILSLAAVFLRLAGVLEMQIPTNEVERMGYYFGTAINIGIAALSLLIAPVIIYGAIKMLKGKSYKLAKTSAILAMIPLVSCCFIAGIPIGIWSLIVLHRPDVKAYFNGEFQSDEFFQMPDENDW